MKFALNMLLSCILYCAENTFTERKVDQRRKELCLCANGKN